jgi:diaminopimelate decarboxylase
MGSGVEFVAGFVRDGVTLRCDGVPVDEIIAATGTPAYLYSRGVIEARYREIDAAFGTYPHALHYALMANSTLAIARLLRELGSAADAISGGGGDRALSAGFAPRQIVFTGVGKTGHELERAVSLGVKAINVESAGEFDRIDAIARARGTRARVALRVNPDIDAESHPHISTGHRTSKFGVSIDEAAALARGLTTRQGLHLVGVHIHVGSQIMTLEPLRRAARAAVELASELRAHGFELEHIDVGGGVGISYDGTPALRFNDYASAILEAVSPTGLELLLEPGRAIVGPAGVLVARVVDVKLQSGGQAFVVIDAGMTELMRPALYGAYHRIEPLVPRDRPDTSCDIVGPVCETTDTLGKARALPLPDVGDLVVIYDTGAYGSVMASNYNRRLMPVEVLVAQGRWRVVKRRQTFDDLLALES